MRIAAITKFKQGDIFEAMQTLGWTFKDLSERTGVNASTLNSYINLRKKPRIASIKKICDAFEMEGIYLIPAECFPEAFKPFKKNSPIVQYLSVPLESLLDCKEAYLIEAPATYESKSHELENEITELIGELSDIDREILILRFGLFGNKEHTLDELGKKYGVTRENIRQKEQRGLRRLRKPDRLKKLEQFIN